MGYSYAAKAGETERAIQALIGSTAIQRLKDVLTSNP